MKLPFALAYYTYEYVNGNITYEHIYTYTTGDLPATPLMSKQYHYDNPVWGDVLTGVSEITYSSNSASAYSLRNENAFANQIFGDREYTALNFNNNIFSSNISVASVNTNTTTNNITVDEIGNMLTYKGVNYQWNGRQLLLMSTDELVLSYEYNMDGQRVKKTLSAPTGEVAYTYEYFYCGDILAGEIFTANPEYFDADSYVLTYMFDESGDYFGFTYNGTPYYYVKNLQNDVYLIIDENGVAQVLYQYDAWGNVVGGYDASTDGLGGVNPITYRSYHYEHETGYYFLTTRYYSPELHRFINADGLVSTGQGVLSNNMFAYCLNNPVNMVDYEGEAPLKVSRYFLTHWFFGDGESLYLDDDSFVSRKLKKSDLMVSIINAEIQQHPNGKLNIKGTNSFDSDEIDLWLGIRGFHYELSIIKETKETGFWIFKKTKTRYVVQVKVWDTFDFDSGNETGDGLGSILNNFGFWLYENNVGVNYYWEANYVYKTKWK